MSRQLETCPCRETAKNTSPGGAKDASETTASRGGVAEYAYRGNACTFSTYADRYRYLRGKAACNPATITFPCCTATTLACNCTEVS